MMCRLVILFLAPLASVVHGFGPATPVFAAGTRASSIDSQNGLTMRIGQGDLRRRGTINSVLRNVVQDSPAATKEAIETKLVTEATSEILKKMNWRRRKAMLHKVSHLAAAHNVPIEATFGVPATQLEREAAEQLVSEPRRLAREKLFKAVNQERDDRVAARTKQEAGSDAERVKQKAIQQEKRAALVEAAAAAEAAKQSKLRDEYDAARMNEEARAEEEADSAAKAAVDANKKNQETQAKKKA
jgi:hypothetical protein